MSKTYTDVQQLIASLGQSEYQILNAVGKAVTSNINDMEADVTANAPRVGDETPKLAGGSKTVDMNIASGLYTTFDNQGADAEIGISGDVSDLAAYIEFGTGTDAAGYVPTLEDDFQRQALQFYKNGKGTLIHVPFFLPAWFRVKDKILSDAQENINKIEL